MLEKTIGFTFVEERIKMIKESSREERLGTEIQIGLKNWRKVEQKKEKLERHKTGAEDSKSELILFFFLIEKGVRGLGKKERNESDFLRSFRLRQGKKSGLL